MELGFVWQCGTMAETGSKRSATSGHETQSESSRAAQSELTGNSRAGCVTRRDARLVQYNGTTPDVAGTTCCSCGCCGSVSSRVWRGPAATPTRQRRPRRPLVDPSSSAPPMASAARVSTCSSPWQCSSAHAWASPWESRGSACTSACCGCAGWLGSCCSASVGRCAERAATPWTNTCRTPPTKLRCSLSLCTRVCLSPVSTLMRWLSPQFQPFWSTPMQQSSVIFRSRSVPGLAASFPCCKDCHYDQSLLRLKGSTAAQKKTH